MADGAHGSPHSVRLGRCALAHSMSDVLEAEPPGEFQGLRSRGGTCAGLLAVCQCPHYSQGQGRPFRQTESTPQLGHADAVSSAVTTCTPGLRTRPTRPAGPPDPPGQADAKRPTPNPFELAERACAGTSPRPHLVTMNCFDNSHDHRGRGCPTSTPPANLPAQVRRASLVTDVDSIASTAPYLVGVPQWCAQPQSSLSSCSTTDRWPTSRATTRPWPLKENAFNRYGVSPGPRCRSTQTNSG